MPRIHFARRTEWNLAPNRLSLALAQHRAGGRPLVDLTASNPTQCGFGYDGTAILQALSQRESLLYEPQPLGLEAARRSISGYYAERGDRVAPSHLLLTTSTSEAYSFVFRLLCNPADELLAPVPSYPLFSFLADIQDVRLVHYPLSFDSEWAIDFPALERALSPRTRGIIVVHPNNPTGHYCRREEIARLSTLAASRGIALIADEVFWDFSLREVRAPSFAGNAETLTFTLSGISKIAGLPQMKAAWLAVSGPDAERSAALERLAIIADTYLSM
ncbi:MAG TPA: pyridoxal phosphate-dependent aminotransferase, partial [Methylomirabilota bacterium]|nr:pyridoxal phosphate-dependent aminotransferase [Methylomirabilota bacterium]